VSPSKFPVPPNLPSFSSAHKTQQLLLLLYRRLPGILLRPQCSTTTQSPPAWMQPTSTLDDGLSVSAAPMREQISRQQTS
jgi:hypothetical protein